MIRALAVTAILLLAASATIAQAQESVDNASQGLVNLLLLWGSCQWLA